MKICIISHALHAYSESNKELQHSSSSNDVLLNLSHGFRSAGHDVFLILPKNSDSSFPMFVADGDYQPKLSSHQSHIHDLLSSATNSSLSQMMDYAFSKQHNFDLIINLSNDWLPLYMTDKFTTLYINIIDSFCDIKFLNNFISNRAINFPDNFLFTSHYLQSSFGLSLIKIIPLPFNTYLFNPAITQKDNFFLWADCIIPEKGLKEALLFSRQLNVPLFVTGEIQNLSYFYQLSNQFNINYLGILNKSSLYSYMNKATALLQFQRKDFWQESLGRVTTEAMLNGCPVIYTDNGANKELVSLTNGGVEFNSSPSIAMQLLSSIDVHSMQNIAKDTFSRDVICQQFIDHFQSLLLKRL